ncbi:hypothetical protein F3Y22_tig00110195pilonHSYRG00054 [Hibiscus syriacus]|uniref:Uncharacterized protein n=1 Tax=Hibiscus syriacus TaxID=106335 RepID=A0A6A3BGC7_HIBSY|nr:hypothetical protein F3Y22_tig00110195pilonHSYRG00054 [Hibiscus syriacus]
MRGKSNPMVALAPNFSDACTSKCSSWCLYNKASRLMFGLIENPD